MKAGGDDPRAIFQETVITLMHILAARFTDAIRSRCSSPNEFSAAHEPGERMLAHLHDLLQQYKSLSESGSRSPEEKAEIAEGLDKYAFLARVQEFILQQIKAAHEGRSE